MTDSGPRVRNIQKQCISLKFNPIQGKAFRDNISPSWCNLSEIEILKELFSDLCALLIELKSVQMTFLTDRLGYGAW